MATSLIVLSPLMADLPSANPATKTLVTSAAAATTNTPKPTYTVLDFTSDTTDQYAIWNIPIPADYLSGPSLYVVWAHTATSGNVVITSGVAPSIIGTTDFDTLATFLAADTSGAVSVPGTAGIDKATTIALTATGGLAGQVWSVFIGRDASDAGDTASGTLRVRGAVLSYTS